MSNLGETSRRSAEKRAGTDARGASRGADASSSGEAARETASAWRRGAELARAVVRSYGTTDVDEICRRAGVQVTRARWALVTAGECDHKRGTIAVNLAAVERAAANGVAADAVERFIVAHELGHLFEVRRRAPRREHDRRHDEQLAHGFAASLMAAATEARGGGRGG